MIKKSIFVVIILLAAGELLTRALITSPSNQTFDPEIGWVYIPYTSMLHAREGFARNTINNIGFNDDSLIFDSDKKHILFLGDSFTEAFHVDRKHNFTSLLETDETLTINAGRSALNPIHFPIIKKRIDDLLPIDTCVLVLSTGDLTDMVNTPMRVEYNAKGNVKNISIKISENDKIKSLIEPVVHHSALATYMMRRLKPLVVESLQVFKDNSAKIDQPDRKTHEDDVQHKERLLAYVFDVLKTRTNNLYVIYIPSIGFDGDGMLPLSDGVKNEMSIISRIAKKSNIPFLSSQSYLEEVFHELGQPPFGFHNSIMGEGHLNIYGHQADARAVTDILRN